jgi:putative ABC transport system permease protein
VLTGVLIEGFIYGIMVMGVFISFRILNFSDMTVDGSFPLGSAIMVTALLGGIPAPAALLMAFVGGCLAGLITALIHTRLKAPDLLSGILTMTMLYSINLRIMHNRANISLLRVSTFFTKLSAWWDGNPFPIAFFRRGDWAVAGFCLLAALAIKFLLDLFFHTDYGLTLGVIGANPQMIISQGMNPDILKISGICLSNGLVAVAGSLCALYQGFADVSLGTGIIVSGLASLMIGEILIRSNKIGWQTLRVLLGSLVYRGLMYLARDYGYYLHLTPNDFKLITGLLIIGCIILSRGDILGAIRRRRAR